MPLAADPMLVCFLLVSNCVAASLYDSPVVHFGGAPLFALMSSRACRYRLCSYSDAALVIVSRVIILDLLATYQYIYWLALGVGENVSSF